MSADDSFDFQAIENFRNYLRIKTVHPDPDYSGCVDFLKKMASNLELDFKTIEYKQGILIVLMTLKGTEPSIESVLLSSHYDVVPVSSEFWKSDPFAADMLPNGDIIARGSQDMKCVGMAYLEAIRRLKRDNKHLKRTIHLVYTPDEEIGSGNGAELFAKQLTELNVGVCFDEGLPSPTDKLYLFNTERSTLCIKLEANGAAGHGSSLPQGTAIEKLLPVLTKFSTWRGQETVDLIKLNGDLGSVNSINITMLNAGKQHNVIPETAEATIDIRVSPLYSLKEVECKINEFCGKNVKWSFTLKHDSSAISSVDPSDLYWKSIHESLKESGVEFDVKIFPGGTDSRFYRSHGFPSYGISPFKNTPILLHDHNEFMNSRIYLDGIEIYVKLIEKIGNC